MTMQPTTTDRAAMGAMNMTPLIDVLLVLLVMFIIAIPIGPHNTEIDIGQSGDIIALPNPVKNKIVVTEDDRILWNGNTVTDDQLRGLLASTKQMVPEPELHFEPERYASYDMSARVTQLIKASGITRLGLVGNDRYQDFGR